MTELTYVQFYALRDDKQTRIMAEVGGDEQVCLIAYDRALVAAKVPLTGIEMHHEGEVPDNLKSYVGVWITFQNDVQ